MRVLHGYPSKILFVDDDTMLTDLLAFAFTREGFSVQVAHRGSQAIQAVRAEPPDIILLDVNLPDTTGFALCVQLRSMANVPIIMLTGRQSIEDTLEGFRQGADDYVSKPFDMRVLSCRVRSVLRRLSAGAVPLDNDARSYSLAGATFNTEFNELRKGAVTVKLTPIEGKILRLLLTHEGQVLSLESILERIWGYDTENSVAVIKTHIRRLRLKIETVLGDYQLIHTVPGLGYTFRQHQPEPVPFTPLRQAMESS